MRGLIHFFSYHNAVPIAISFVLLGAATTYAATNPEKIISKEDSVISIDNTYIAKLDFKRFSPTVKILSVTEDEESYYIAYRFTTVDLKDAVWQNITTDETMTVEKARLGAYRDLGLFVTQQLREKIQNEVQRLKETQEIEKKNVTQKKIVTKYKGLVGGFLDDEETVIDGYTPVVKPPKPIADAQTFARPDPNAKPEKPVPPKEEIPVVPVEEPVMEEPVTGSTTDDTPADTGSGSTGTSTTATSTDTGTGGSSEPENEPPTLEILGDNPVYLMVGDTYTDLGAVATDDHDTDLSIEVFLDSTTVENVAIDTSVSGEHIIAYESKDSAGAVSRVERTVIIKAPAPTSEDAATSTPEGNVPPVVDESTSTGETSPSVPEVPGNLAPIPTEAEEAPGQPVESGTSTGSS